MEIGGIPVHVALAYAAAVLGPVGCLLSLVYAARPDNRDWWRRPMMIGAVLAAAAILASWFTGRDLIEARPRLADDPQIIAHLEYADRLVLPTTGYLVIALLTGWLNPRTGALRLMLPLLLTGFAVVVLAILLLSSDSGIRLAWERLLADL